MIVSLIAAVSDNGIIGRDGGLPWRLPADLPFFKLTTLGHTVIMGRKTWDELGKPLPNRRNIVVTRNKGLDFPGAERAPFLGTALAMAMAEDEVFVIAVWNTLRFALVTGPIGFMLSFFFAWL